MSDDRESPSVEVVELLIELGARVDIVDPTLTPEAIGSRGLRAAVGPHDREYELALILTDHDDVDYMAVADSAVAVFDTRAAYRRRGIHAANVTEI